MKTIGMIGGMSYESSIHYYERINNQVNQIAGGLTCAKMLIYNVNFEEIRKLMLENKWDEIGREICFPSGMDHMGPVIQKLYDTLTGIQLGTVDAPEGWIHKIC